MKQPNGRFCQEHLQVVLHGGKDPDPGPLVLIEDRDLIPDHLYLTVEQMVPCRFGSSEKSPAAGEKYTGYPGLMCKHCLGKTSGRWYPSSESAMYVSTFTKGLVNHVLNCPQCPSEVRSFSFIIYFFEKL